MTNMIDAATPMDIFIYWEPLRAGGASFLSGIDNETGTIRMTGGGIWQPSDAQRYFDQQRRVIEQARRRFGCLKICMDVRAWVVEDSHSVEQFQNMNSELYAPHDRFAALVKSSADKQHARDAVPVGIREAFLSPGAAEVWLQAHSTGSSRQL